MANPYPHTHTLHPLKATLSSPPQASLKATPPPPLIGKVYGKPGLYTAISKDGIHWHQQEARGQPALVGAYGNPGD